MGALVLNWFFRPYGSKPSWSFLSIKKRHIVEETQLIIGWGQKQLAVWHVTLVSWRETCFCRLPGHLHLSAQNHLPVCHSRRSYIYSNFALKIMNNQPWRCLMSLQLVPSHGPGPRGGKVWSGHGPPQGHDCPAQRSLTQTPKKQNLQSLLFSHCNVF